MEIKVQLDTVNKNQANFKGELIRSEEPAYVGNKRKDVYVASVYIDRDVWGEMGRPNELIVLTPDELEQVRPA